MSILNFFKNLFTEKKEEKPKITAQVKMETSVNHNTSIDPIYKKKLSDGLLPGEVILIDWLDGKSPDVNTPRYFEYTYGLNTNESINKLMENGYLRKSNSYESLPSLKVPDLKEILKQQSLKQSGKKADLIERIKETLSYNEVSEHMNQYFLKITDLGYETLKHYYYIVPAHKNDSKDGIYNVATAIKFVNYHKGNYNPPNGDISWALFQKAYMKEAENYNYGLMRNIIMNKANQLKNEEQFKNSLFHYLRVYVFDTSGLSNGKRLLHPNHQNYTALISDSIESLMYVLDFSENNLKKMFDNVWNQSEKELIFHYLTKDECFEGLLRSFEDNEEEFLKQRTFVSYKKLNKNSFEEKYNIDYPIDYSEYLDR